MCVCVLEYFNVHDNGSKFRLQQLSCCGSTAIMLWLQRLSCCGFNGYHVVAPTAIMLWLQQLSCCGSNGYHVVAPMTIMLWLHSYHSKPTLPCITRETALHSLANIVTLKHAPHTPITSANWMCCSFIGHLQEIIGRVVMVGVRQTNRQGNKCCGDMRDLSLHETEMTFLPA